MRHTHTQTDVAPDHFSNVFLWAWTELAHLRIDNLFRFSFLDIREFISSINQSITRGHWRSTRDMKQKSMWQRRGVFFPPFALSVVLSVAYVLIKCTVVFSLVTRKHIPNIFVVFLGRKTGTYEWDLHSLACGKVIAMFFEMAFRQQSTAACVGVKLRNKTAPFGFVVFFAPEAENRRGGRGKASRSAAFGARQRAPLDDVQS